MLDYIMTVTDERGYVIQQETVQADDIHEAVDFFSSLIVNYEGDIVNWDSIYEVGTSGGEFASGKIEDFLKGELYVAIEPIQDPL